jgi:hypothetical protein
MVHYRVYKSPPPVPILIKMIPVHIPKPYFSKIHLMLSSHLRLGLPSGLLPSGLPTKKCCMHPSPPHMPRPSHPPRFDHPNNTGRRTQTMQLLIMQFAPTSCHFIPRRCHYESKLLIWTKREKCCRIKVGFMFRETPNQVHFFFWGGGSQYLQFDTLLQNPHPKVLYHKMEARDSLQR